MLLLDFYKGVLVALEAEMESLEGVLKSGLFQTRQSSCSEEPAKRVSACWWLGSFNL